MPYFARLLYFNFYQIKEYVIKQQDNIFCHLVLMWSKKMMVWNFCSLKYFPIFYRGGKQNLIAYSLQGCQIVPGFSKAGHNFEKKISFVLMFFFI